jgi:hypothetical protein
MTLLRVVSAQVPEPPLSDDRVHVLDHAVIVLDGASAVDSREVSTGTYVDTLGAELTRGLEGPRTGLSDVLAAAIERTASRLRLRRGDAPSSTVAIVRVDGDTLDVLVLGDSQVVTPAGTIRDDRLARIATSQRAAYQRRLAEGNGYDQNHRDLLRALQAEQARHRNKAGGFWIAEVDPEAANHALTARLPIQGTSWVALATDGAYRPLEHLGFDNWPDLAVKSATQLTSILQCCHQWESTTDASGVALPRSKKHDDKTLALVAIGTGHFND